MPKNPDRTNIRQYKDQDIDAIVEIWKRANAMAHPFLSKAFVAREVQEIRDSWMPNSETWVLISGSHPVGFISLLGNEIGGLFLDPAYHRRGLGRAMVDHAVDLRGALCVEVFKKNMVARPFYEHTGFVLVEEYWHEMSDNWIVKMAMP